MFRNCVLATLVVIASTSAAEAGDDVSCTTEPQAAWMSVDAITTMALTVGYKHIRDVKIQGSCYDVYGMTAKDVQARVLMNPVTGDVVKAEIGN